MSRGSRRFRPEFWIPTSKDPFQFFVEHLGPCLEQEMCSTEGPLHLLLLDYPSNSRTEYITIVPIRVNGGAECDPCSSNVVT